MPLTDAEKKALENALSLAKSGGIYYEGARVTGGTANRWLLVGAGGMGTSTLIRVKHEIMNRMKLPDDGNRKRPPENIAFLAIDTQQGSLDNLSYSDTKFEADEIVYTGAQGTSWQSIINGMLFDKKNNPTGYASFLPDKIPGMLPPDAAAGAKRLLGRVGLYKNQNQLVSRINSAVGKIGAATGDTQICLFAGLGGGTGSGSFIDLAFLLKNILGAGGANCPLSAYLYLPDIQDHVAAGHNDRIVNTVAALKELDQVVRLGNNNPGKNHRYIFGSGGPEITFTGNPFDYCYLINKTDSKGNVHDPDNVVGDVSESVFELVADQTAINIATNTNDSGQGAINANASTHFDGVDGNCQFPANYRYMSTCSDVRRIPFLEINTLVVSEMFDQLSHTVLMNPVTIGSINRDLIDLGFTTNITGLDQANIVNIQSYINIENTMQTILGRETYSGEDLGVNTRLIGEPNGYTADDIWRFADCYGGDGSPYYAAKQALAEYQIGLNANLGLQIGDGQNIGELEMKLKKFILDKITNPSYGPVYIADVIGGVSTALNLIALFSRVKTRCRGAAQTARYEAALATEDNANRTGFKYVFDEVRRAHRRPGRKDAEKYLEYLEKWQEASRSEQMYLKMEEFCEAIINVYTRYYINILEPLKDAILKVTDIFAMNKATIEAQHRDYAQNPDKHLLIYPMDFKTKYTTVFDTCVNNAKSTFLDNLENHLPDWIGVTISATSSNPADHMFNPDRTRMKIPESISLFVSDHLSGLYGAVNIETIYQQKFGAGFLANMQTEIISLYNSSNPMFSKNAIPDAGITQEYAILYVPAVCENILIAANNVANGALAGKMQVIACEDVSRLSIIKVGEGYSLVMNKYLNIWEPNYDSSISTTTHLSVEWKEKFPSPNVEASWNLTGYNSERIHERNKNIREKFMFCYEHGLISITATAPLEAEMKLGVTEILGQKTEEYIKNARLPGSNLAAKSAALNGIFANIWGVGLTERFPGMGRYKRGVNETQQDLIDNVMETTLLDSKLCSIIEREYNLLLGYVALKKSFETPELYVKALMCHLIKYNNVDFHISLYSTDDISADHTEITQDDSVKLGMDDFDYLIYEKFSTIMDNNAGGNITWRAQITQNWKQLLLTAEHPKLYDEIQKRTAKFLECKSFFDKEANQTLNNSLKNSYIDRMNFYEMCILYANKLKLGLSGTPVGDGGAGGSGTVVHI